MSDPHLNIFHAYRGSTRSEDAALRQLEDNLTRALAITLDAARDTAIAQPVLDALQFEPSDTREPYQLRLQVTGPPSALSESARRRLLVIHGGPKLQITDSISNATSGRVDVVVATRRFLLAIESKLENIVEQSQLDRHREAFGIPEDEIFDITWSDLVRSIRSTRVNRRSHPVAPFVLDQFEEYLRMNGYGGLTHEHFAFFALPADQRDPLVKDGIRRALGEIGSEIVEGIGTAWHPHLLNISAGDSNAGVVIEPGERARKPHLTISIDAAGLNIHTNIELEGPYRKFRRALKADPGGLVQLVRDLGKNRVASKEDVPWRFTVVRRTPLGPPRQYHYYPAADIASVVLRQWTDEEIAAFIDTVTRKPDGEAAPEVLLVKRYPAADVITADELVSVLLRDILEVERFFKWIGEGLR